MNILIINDLLISGGAEMQSRREKEILESKGHRVHLLTFDKDFPKDHAMYNEMNGFFNIPLKNIGVTKIFRKLFCDERLLLTIKKIINKIKPDIIHINNLYISPITQYMALNGYKCVQTIRDYSAVCPISTCVYSNWEVCKGAKYNRCTQKCKEDFIRINIKNYMFKKINKLRKKNISIFICPSEKLTEYCKDHDFNIFCINNPFDFTKLDNLIKNMNYTHKKYLYFGAINEIKGVFKLLNAFNEFSENKDVELVIAGKCDNKNLEILEPYLHKNQKISYLGFLSYEKMLKVLERTYSVIVPSL